MTSIKEKKTYYTLNFNKDKYDRYINDGIDNNLIFINGKIDSEYHFIELYDNNKLISGDIYEKFLYTILSKLLIPSVIEKINNALEYMITTSSNEVNTIENGYNRVNIRWVQCRNTCKKLLQDLFNEEKTYTICWIIYLLKYIIHPSNVMYKLVLRISQQDLSSITGDWEQDLRYFKLEYISTNDEYGDIPQEKFKLTMYGPSASGKTFFGKTLIDMLYDLNNNKKYLKKSFIAIDGGISREYSITYRIINSILDSRNSNDESSKQRINLSDVSINITIPGVYRKIKRTFSGESKYIFKGFQNNIIDFYYNTINPYNVYLPTTYVNFYKVASKKVKSPTLVGGLERNFDIEYNCCIYQCLNKCYYKDDYKCMTTKYSGIKRSISEGKRYNGKMHEYSLVTGLDVVKQTGGLHIHNSGHQDRRSILIDYSIGNNLINLSNIKSSGNFTDLNNISEGKNITYGDYKFTYIRYNGKDDVTVKHGYFLPFKKKNVSIETNATTENSFVGGKNTRQILNNTNNKKHKKSKRTLKNKLNASKLLLSKKKLYYKK
jgi:hypothetical protein